MPAGGVRCRQVASASCRSCLLPAQPRSRPTPRTMCRADQPGDAFCGPRGAGRWSLRACKRKHSPGTRQLAAPAPGSARSARAPPALRLAPAGQSRRRGRAAGAAARAGPRRPRAWQLSRSRHPAGRGCTRCPAPRPAAPAGPAGAGLRGTRSRGAAGKRRRHAGRPVRAAMQLRQALRAAPACTRLAPASPPTRLPHPARQRPHLPGG